MIVVRGFRSTLIAVALVVAGSFVTRLAIADGEGEQISPQMAIYALPYAEIAQDAYNPTSQLSKTDLDGRWQRIADWQSFLAAHKVAPDVIRRAQNAGFYAAIYKDAWTGDVAIAFRGTRGVNANDFITDADLKLGLSRPGAAEAARELAALVKKDNPQSKITLTGHSLGGYWATYAGERAGIDNVVTFNSARGPDISTYKNAHQINIVVSGELIGDPNTGNWLGQGRLPGKLFGVDSIFGSPKVSDDLGSQGIEGIINGLNLQALKAPIPKAAAAAAPATATAPADRVLSPASQSTAPLKDAPKATAPVATVEAHRIAGPPPAPVQKSAARDSTPAGQQKSSGVRLNPDLYTSKRDLVPVPQQAERQYRPAPPTQAPVSGFNSSANWHPERVSSYAPAASSFVALRAPGGISISKAAAERMPIGFDIETSYLKNGPLILSGRKDSTGSIDAAIMLTAIRAACEPSDPYFSLDTDGIEWISESKRAREELISKIRGDLFISKLTPTYPVGTSYRTVSARRDYPAIWGRISGKYPHLRSKLVFRPSWLAQTRFGEILYKGDVLLKELAGGSPVFSDGTVKAGRVSGYMSYSMRVVSKGLQGAGNGVMHMADKGSSRLWFDLISPDEKNAFRDNSRAEKLTLISARRVIQDGSALDFSSIYPRIFVKRHDLASNTDLDVPQPEMDALSSQRSLLSSGKGFSRTAHCPVAA